MIDLSHVDPDSLDPSMLEGVPPCSFHEKPHKKKKSSRHRKRSRRIMEDDDTRERPTKDHGEIKVEPKEEEEEPVPPPLPQPKLSGMMCSLKGRSPPPLIKASLSPLSRYDIMDKFWCSSGLGGFWFCPWILIGLGLYGIKFCKVFIINVTCWLG